MKKLKLKLEGKEMLSKDQMKKIAGGYHDPCQYIDPTYENIWYCCETSSYFIYVVGWYNCSTAQAQCSQGVVAIDPYNGCPWQH